MELEHIMLSEMLERKDIDVLFIKQTFQKQEYQTNTQQQQQWGL